MFWIKVEEEREEKCNLFLFLEGSCFWYQLVDGEVALTILSSRFYLSLFNVLVRSVERQMKLRESLLTCSIADKASTCFKTHSDHSFFFFFLFLLNV